MIRCFSSLSRAAAISLCSALFLLPAPASSDGKPTEWNARHAEHLLNRAGFGASTEEVARFVAMGQDAAIESLFPDPSRVPQPDILGEASLPGDLVDPAETHATVEGRREGFVRLQSNLIAALNHFGDWWIERMITSDDPLRDHMTIFWHGHFVSSLKEVGNSHAIIRQIRFLRENALGDFEALARGMGRDGAMLRYLNNDNNVKGHPNENWARELMELFTLGDGNYTENDIKESARAFTGWSQERSRFVYHRLDHDFEQKTLLGVTGNFDGDHVVDIIFEQPACGRFIAGKLIAYFEGFPPAQERVEDYATFLRSNDYNLGKLLRRLFHDPAFYRDEIVGNRVAGPIEYLVGASRRLGMHPPGQMVLAGGDMLGQRLFWPPSVKGWEGDMSWINTASIMHRSNVIGTMLGTVETAKLLSDSEADRSDRMAGEAMATPASSPQTAPKKISAGTGIGLLNFIQESGWQPDLDLRASLAPLGAKPSDSAIAGRMIENLLAVPAAPGTLEEVARFLSQERETLGIREGELDSADARAEALLRRTAHLILSLPEAQLN